VSDSNRIIAAAPFMTYTSPFLRVTTLEFLGGSDYHSFLLTKADPNLVRTILEYVCQKVPDWGLINMNCIPYSSVTARILAQLSMPSPRFTQRPFTVCPYAPLPRSYDAYLSSLGRQFTKKLAKQERQLLLNYKFEVKFLKDPESVQKGLKAFFDLHDTRLTSIGEPVLSEQKGFRDFLVDIAESTARRRWFVLALLTLNDEPVAATYNFRYGNKLYGYLSGFNSLYSKYSVGSLLYMHMMRQCISDGLYEFDFLEGDEPYKASWNTLRRTTLRFEATNKKILPRLLRLSERAMQLIR
jgi:hypothetical protein